MAKITVRLPTEQYAYIELEFANIEEYQENYPKIALAIKETRLQTAKLLKDKKEAEEFNQPPFKGNEFSKETKYNN